MPQGWTPEMSHFVRENFLRGEELESVKELFFAEYKVMVNKLLANKLLEKKVLDAWFISLRPAECS